MSAFDDVGTGVVAPNCKNVVVGLDFGTAYSGVAIVYRADPKTLMPCAPGSPDEATFKVPTALLKLDNGEWDFGHSAERRYVDIMNGEENPGSNPVHLFKDFKMVLKGKEDGFDSLKALSVAGQAHSLMDLVVQSLIILKKCAVDKIKIGFGQQNAELDIQWVLTVPAIWNEFGKKFMRKAALKAGLIDTELSENLMLVLEPEGAALAVHAGQKEHKILTVGKRFMVLDCGGGTVDITVHEVTSTSPLRLKTVGIPTGGAWGGNYVNEEFKKFLREFLGEQIYVEVENSYYMHNVMAEFDLVKKAFVPPADPGYIRLIDLVSKKTEVAEFAAAYNTKHPDKQVIKPQVLRNGNLAMSPELMLSFFEPMLVKTVEAVRAQLVASPGVSTIMLVGGFGASQVVISRIRDEFHNKNGVKVIMPDPSPKPQAAIVQGAVLFGLHKNIIGSRLSPYTYGIAMRVNGVNDCFHILVRKGQELPEDHVREQSGAPGSPSQTALTWRIFRSDLTSPTTVKGELLLGTVTAKCPPNPDSSMRVQMGRFMFGGPEIMVTIRNAAGEEYKVAIEPPGTVPNPAAAGRPAGSGRT